MTRLTRDLLPTEKAAELWQRSGRYAIDELLKLQDRRGAELVLVMTHWEQVLYGNDNPQGRCEDRSPSDARGDSLVNYIFSYPLDWPPDTCGATC